jgi:tRNA-modifying protein YgfZ
MPASTPAELIELAGPDATAFAQAQFCNDVSTLAVGASQLNAWLNPQGRVRRFFHLVRSAEARYLLLLRGGDAASILATLRMFVLRLKVQVQALPGWHWGETAAPAESSNESNLPVALPGGRGLLLADTAFTAAVSRAESLARDIEAGLPWLPDHALEQLLPSWMEFARLEAISHAKGCYPGQEIVARLHFRGGGDKRVPAVLAASTSLDGAATLRDASGGEAGLLLQWEADGAGAGRALAVIRRDLDIPGSVLDGGIAAPLKVVQKPW